MNGYQDRTIDQIIDEVDTNKDGRIDYEEFLRSMSKKWHQIYFDMLVLLKKYIFFFSDFLSEQKSRYKNWLFYLKFNLHC